VVQLPCCLNNLPSPWTQTPLLLSEPPTSFYEAEFVKTRCENSLCFIFCSFLPTSDNNSPLWLWCLIIAAGVYAAMIKRQSQLLLSAQRSWFKANNGIKGRGPPEAGRMPFMPAVSLNQWSGALPKRGLAFQLRFFSDSLPPFSVFAFCAVQSFGFPQRLLSTREL
jgi:hypothetical protein